MEAILSDEKARARTIRLLQRFCSLSRGSKRGSKASCRLWLDGGPYGS